MKELVDTCVAIVGMGTMGNAIHHLLETRCRVTGIGRGGDLAAIGNADVVVMAVKPQSFTAAAEKLWRWMDDKQTVISIMAGLTIDTVERHLGTDRVVRTMPNLALSTGQSLTAWYCKKEENNTGAVKAILATWGDTLKLDSEAQFDSFTAVVGSGPAYFFEMADALEKAAVAQGFYASSGTIYGHPNSTRRGECPAKH